MTLELKVPEVGESITEVQIGAWKKSEGEAVTTDEPIVEIESDKATLELLAPAAGTLKVTAQSGSDQKVGAIVARIDEKAKRPAGAPAGSATPSGAAASAAKAAEAPAAK